MEKKPWVEILSSPQKFLTRKRKRDSYFYSSSSITSANGYKVIDSRGPEENVCLQFYISICKKSENITT